MIFTKKYRTGQIVLTACIVAVCMFSNVHGTEAAGPPAPKTLTVTPPEKPKSIAKSKSTSTSKSKSTPKSKSALTQKPEATPIPASTPTPEQEAETDKQNPADQGTLSKPDHPDTISADKLVFIGDSRTVGLRDYGGWDNATYYASIGLTVYDMFDTPIVEENGAKITIEEALSKHQFGKVYLMIGINEMGTGTVDSFMKKYEEAVNHIRELQPDALIFLQGIMYVKQEKSETDPIFNNPAIKERNDRIAMLANNHDIFYIDVNEVVTDETGNLNPEYTYDEIHLLGKYYSLWTDFLLKHGIKKE